MATKKVILKDVLGNVLLPDIGKEVYSQAETNNLLNGKQSTLNSNQLNAVNSGITSALVGKYNGYETSINGKQPSGDYATKTELNSRADTGLSNITQAGKEIIKAQIDLSAYATNAKVDALPKQKVVSVAPAQPEANTFYFVME